jgi:hypothetical protein
MTRAAVPSGGGRSFVGGVDGVNCGRTGFGRVPRKRGPGCARRRARYNRAQRRRAPCAPGQRYCCCPAAPGSRPCGRASLTQRQRRTVRRVCAGALTPRPPLPYTTSLHPRVPAPYGRGGGDPLPNPPSAGPALAVHRPTGLRLRACRACIARGSLRTRARRTSPDKPFGPARPNCHSEGAHEGTRPCREPRARPRNLLRARSCSALRLPSPPMHGPSRDPPRWPSRIHARFASPTKSQE